MTESLFSFPHQDGLPTRMREILREYSAERATDSEEFAVRRLAYALCRAEWAREEAEQIYRWPWWRRLRGW